MSTQREYTVEDFKGIQVEDSWTAFDVLVAVAVEAQKKESLNNNVQEPPIDEINKLRLPVKKRRVSEPALASQENKKRRVMIPNVVRVVAQLQPNLPDDFKKIIAKLREGKDQTGENIMEPFLVIQKKLFKTDTSKGHNRFSIPVNQMSCTDFLTEEEKQFIEGRKEDEHKHTIGVKIIEPLLGVGTVNLAKWDMEKPGGGKKSESYILNGKWNDIKDRNHLKEGMDVQLWAFRVEQDLCLALVKLP